MVKLRTLAEAEKVLAKYIPMVHELMGKDLSLKRMGPLMKLLGNPEKDLGIIHVAGTSGKTSTCYYIAALLTAAGKKTGLTVSPHIDTITERLQINLRPVTEAEFCKLLDEFLNIIEPLEDMPSYFELLVAFAYWYFKKAGVDYAVVETGLGGLYDSTNIAANADKLCVITDIGFDHMHVLGNTLDKIALQKAGIIHPGNEVLMYRQPVVIQDAIEEWCRQQGTHLHALEQSDLDLALPAGTGFGSLPEFQRRNWLLAYEVYKFLMARDGLAELSAGELQETMRTPIPGRMDIRQVGDKTVIMDGAHNGQKMRALVNSFQKLYPGKRLPIMLSLKKGKEYKEILPLLKPITSMLILTSFNLTQNIQSRSIDTEKLAAAARIEGFQNVTVENNQDIAYGSLLAQNSSMVLITGSLYLLAQLRHTHKDLHG